MYAARGTFCYSLPPVTYTLRCSPRPVSLHALRLGRSSLPSVTGSCPVRRTTGAYATRHARGARQNYRAFPNNCQRALASEYLRRHPRCSAAATCRPLTCSARCSARKRAVLQLPAGAGRFQGPPAFSTSLPSDQQDRDPILAPDRERTCLGPAERSPRAPPVPKLEPDQIYPSLLPNGVFRRLPHRSKTARAGARTLNGSSA